MYKWGLTCMRSACGKNCPVGWVMLMRKMSFHFQQANNKDRHRTLTFILDGKKNTRKWPYQPTNNVKQKMLMDICDSIRWWDLTSGKSYIRAKNLSKERFSRHWKNLEELEFSWNSKKMKCLSNLMVKRLSRWINFVISVYYREGFKNLR